MGEHGESNFTGLSLELARRIDAVCRRFEADWRAGGSPRIEDYAADVPDEGRVALRAELVALEHELRQAQELASTAGGGAGSAPAVGARLAVAGAEEPTVAPGASSTAPVPDDAPDSVHDEATIPPRRDPTIDLIPLAHDMPTTAHGQLVHAGADESEPVRVRYFGDYEIIREIARGGMGVVFQARQVSLNRPVALKMILAGQLADETDVNRFYTEPEAAANLDQPGIVPVYEVGQHEGQHYFSMGYIEGQSLAQRLADGPLPAREAADLIRRVAEAIEYAHQHGVIHRDLKPANVLLDRSGNPRVSDFGLAKKVKGDSDLTGSGQIMGTPSYMPPEQAGGKRGEVGPTADVYALGATLYALVTGRPPFQAATAMDTIVQVLSDEPLPARRLNATVPRDLETICLKCLEKDPARRYPSARALADDLGRYLAGEPIVARAVTRLERAVKWARRKPAIATLLGLITLVTFLGLGGVLWQWREAVQARGIAEHETIRAKNQAELAEQRRLEADERRHEAELARVEAQKRLAQIKKSNEIITSIFADLDIRKVKAGTDPLEAVLAQRLVKAASDLEGEAIGDPLVAAGLQDRLGATLLNLGHSDEAIPLFQKAIETRKAKLGADHHDTLSCMHNLARGYQNTGRPDRALPLLEQILSLTKSKLGADHPDTLTSMGSLAWSYQSVGKLDLAVPLLEEAVKLEKAKLGPDNPITLISMNDLALCYQSAGKLDLALPLYEETLRLTRAKLGVDHPNTLAAMNNLAFGYWKAGKLDKAVPLSEETLKLMRARLGSDHPETLTCMNNLARGYQDAGIPARALPLFLEAAEGVEKSQFQHEYPQGIVEGLIACYERLGQFDQAEAWRRKWLPVLKERSGAESAAYAAGLSTLGLNLIEQKKFTDAEVVLREGLAIRERQAPDDWTTFSTRSLLGSALLGQKKYAEAERLLRNGHEGLSARAAKIPQPLRMVRLTQAIERLIQLYTALEKKDEAAKWRNELKTVSKAGNDSRTQSR